MWHSTAQLKSKRKTRKRDPKNGQGSYRELLYTHTFACWAARRGYAAVSKQPKRVPHPSLQSSMSIKIRIGPQQESSLRTTGFFVSCSTLERGYLASPYTPDYPAQGPFSSCIY